MNVDLAENDAHSIRSSAREKVIEHLFLGELMRCLWRKGMRDLEVLRADVDMGGYDLVLEAKGITRHVQLKASHLGAKTKQIKINTALAGKPSGCVVWIRFDAETMNLGPFHWFGGEPGAALPPLGDRVAKHTKGDGTGRKLDRPRIRVVARSQFRKLSTIEEVVHSLFGL